MSVLQFQRELFGFRVNKEVDEQFLNEKQTIAFLETQLFVGSRSEFVQSPQRDVIRAYDNRSCLFRFWRLWNLKIRFKNFNRNTKSILKYE